ncbi:hypothetical protein N0V90_011414 [Kalmusia sp. IMI 367209]|nr:hypothetical protein N0V90_011414 [Kalmusia sp. IMI 367209]
MFSKALALSTLFASALAVPDVTVKELPTGCSSYPGYNADTDLAGPWTVQVSNSDNPAIEGFSDTSAYSLAIGNNGRPTLRWGYLTIPTRNDIAKNPLECTGDVLRAWVPTEVTAAGAPTNYQWTPLALSPYWNDGSLLWKVDGDEVKIYEHYVGEEKQPGVFLGGYDNSTTWGFKYYPASATSSDYGYFSMRLLPTDGQLSANETKGFVKITGS